MGIDPRTLSVEARRRAGIEIVGGHTRRTLLPALPGRVYFHFRGDPPTVTHHDKRTKPDGGMYNTPRLQAAWAYYLSQIPQRRDRAPIQPPVRADITFWFPLPPHPDPAAGEVAGAPMIRKPDRDNAMKVLMDCLTVRGYLIDDAHVTDGAPRKRWAWPGRSGVEVCLCTMDNTHPD